MSGIEQTYALPWPAPSATAMTGPAWPDDTHAWPGPVETMPYGAPHGGLAPMPYVLPDESVAPMPYVLPDESVAAMPYVLPDESVAPMPYGLPDDPAATAPGSDLAPTEPATRVVSPDTGDYVGHGVKGYLVPSIVAGGLLGALGASIAPTGGSKAAVFAGALAASTLSGVINGAATGLIVAGTSPKPGDDVTARYALSGAGFGAATGALMPGVFGRPASIAINATFGAIMGYLIGRDAPRPTVETVQEPVTDDIDVPFA